MEVFTSGKYRKKTEIAAEILDEEAKSLRHEERRQLEILEQRGETHRKIEAVTSGTCNVFRGTAFGDSRVAGYNDGQSHLREDILDDYGFALHVKRHEDLHGVVMKDVNIAKYLTADQLRALSKAVNEPALASVNLMEGFTELINVRRNGRDERCDYLKKEVPVAQQLDELAAKKINISLSAAFARNDAAMFYFAIDKLAGQLVTESRRSASN